jgi:hypothetical protein
MPYNGEDEAIRAAKSFLLFYTECTMSVETKEEKEYYINVTRVH